MSGAVPLLTLHVFMACTGTALPLPLSITYYLHSHSLLPFNGEITWKTGYTLQVCVCVCVCVCVHISGVHKFLAPCGPGN